MTEPKRKAPAKKAPRAKAEPKPKVESKTKTANTDLKDAVLDTALKHAAKDGFTDALLTKAGKEVGADQETLARLFPEGGLGLIAAFSARADAGMEQRLAKMNLAKLKIRERIAAAVRARLDVLAPHKDAARRAVATLTLPPHAALGAKLLYRSVDAMWHAVGDTSTDFNFYTKRAILAGVYSSTLLRWFKDDSKDSAPTDEFLTARIDNVMQFEKFKSGVKKGFADMPSFSEWLRGAAKKSTRA